MLEATRHLLKLGLSEKEACVYLALLECGPSTVQQLAEKSGVNRSTAYALLESLKLRGLSTQIDFDGKTLFSPESPRRLGELLEEKVQEVAIKRENLAQAMPDLLALFNAIEGKPRVRYFEGPAGIVEARAVMLEHVEEEFLSFTSIDEGTIELSKIEEKERQRIARRVRGRLIVSCKPGIPMPETDLHSWEVNQIPFGQAPFSGEINIYGGKVGTYAVQGRPLGLLIESSSVAQLFRAIFEAAWRTALPWNPS